MADWFAVWKEKNAADGGEQGKTGVPKDAPAGSWRAGMQQNTDSVIDFI
jgi:hypothetical protein